MIKTRNFIKNRNFPKRKLCNDPDTLVKVNRDNLGSQFRSGCLFGEILHKYGYISDNMMNSMHDSKSNEGAIRNFTLLRSAFEELEIKVFLPKFVPKILDFLPEFLFLTTISIFDLNFDFLTITSTFDHFFFIFDQNFDQFLIVDQNFDQFFFISDQNFY